MPKTIACVIARTVSTRLPLKVLRTVSDNYCMLDFIIQRLKKLKEIDSIYLCTSKEPVDEILEDVASRNEIKIYKGSADAVIERMLDVAEIEKADNLIRVTGDNVFNAYEYIDSLVKFHNEHDLDYSRIADLPFGSTPEVMSLRALKDCYNRIDPAISEYLTIFMFLPDLYKCGVITFKAVDNLSNYTLTVDTPHDLFRTKAILNKYTGKNKLDITIKEIYEIIKKHSIPYSTIDPSKPVKLPHGVTVSFQDFINDLKDRASKSLESER